MATHSGHWSRWCRLCAKYDPENSFEFQNGVILNGLLDDIKLTVEQTIEKYLCLKTLDKCIPANSMCNECYSYLVAHIKFNQRVQRVQEMFKFLELTPIDELCDLESIRLKFNVTADNTLPEPTDPKYNFAKSVDSQIEIKQELSGPEELVDDDDCRTAGHHENDDDLLHSDDDNQSEFSLKSEARNESLNLICETVNVNSSVNRGRNKRKRRTREEVRHTDEETSRCKKNENTSKDFPLDVSCGECNENFALYSYYYKHLKLHHSNSVMENRWKCPACDSILQTRDSFKRHMRLHMPAERLPIKCPQCDNRYQTNVQLAKHIKHRHCNEKPYICEECGIGISTLSNLKQHIITHSNLTPFGCKMCKKNFKSSALLKRHMDTHDPKKHICTICGLELNSRITLRRHFLVHSDDMQHKCDYCGRAFKRSKTLKTHLLLHTGLKPYSCDFCDRTFANGSNCRSHMKKMHPIELASLEASGGRTHAHNIPKLVNLKALTKTADHLTPVATHSVACIPLDAH